MRPLPPEAKHLRRDEHVALENLRRIERVTQHHRREAPLWWWHLVFRTSLFLIRWRIPLVQRVAWRIAYGLPWREER